MLVRSKTYENRVLIIMLFFIIFRLNIIFMSMIIRYIIDMVMMLSMRRITMLLKAHIYYMVGHTIMCTNSGTSSLTAEGFTTPNIFATKMRSSPALKLTSRKSQKFGFINGRNNLYFLLNKQRVDFANLGKMIHQYNLRSNCRVLVI